LDATAAAARRACSHNGKGEKAAYRAPPVLSRCGRDVSAEAVARQALLKYAQGAAAGNKAQPVLSRSGKDAAAGHRSQTLPAHHNAACAAGLLSPPEA